ncbi:MAG: hypothetical protein K6T65_06720 [Peptococcaceae bacterium]|nr:hypothetical protein [Peptococcaceae bacterium]
MAKIKINGFQPGVSTEERKVEDEISRASRCMMDHIYIRANLPGLLAKIALAGHSDKALDALIAWGTGRRPILELWKEMSPLAENLNDPRSDAG